MSQATKLRATTATEITQASIVSAVIKHTLSWKSQLLLLLMMMQVQTAGVRQSVTACEDGGFGSRLLLLLNWVCRVERDQRRACIWGAAAEFR